MSKAINAVKWTVLDNIVLQVFSLVVYFVLAAKLEISNFGFVNLSSLIIMMLSLVVNFGFNVAIIQKKELSKIEIDSAFIIIIGLGVVLSISLFLTAPVISEFFNQPELNLIIRYMSSILVFKAFSIVPDSLLQRDMKFKQLAFRNVVSSFISGVVAIYLAYNDFEYFSLVGQQISQAFIGMILLWFSIKWSPSMNFSFVALRKLFDYAKLIFATNIISLYNKEGLRLFISYFLGPTSLGYYSLANRLFLMSNKILYVSLNKVSLPHFSRIQDDLDKIRRSFYKVTQLTTIIVFPLLFALLVFSEDVILLLLGQKWENSIGLFQILLIVSFINCLSFFNGSVITALGKVNWRLKLSIVRAVLGTVLFFIGANISLKVLVLMLVVRALIVEPWQFRLIGGLIKVNWKKYAGNVFRPLVPSLILGLFAYLLGQELEKLDMSEVVQYSILFVEFIIGAILYIVIIRWTDRKNYLVLLNYLLNFRQNSTKETS